MSDLAPSHTLVLQRLPTGVVCLDADGRIQLANDAVTRLFGCASPDELIGIPIHTYVQFIQLGAAGQEECVRDDGSSFPVEYESAPLETGGTIVTLRDVSQRAAAERRKDELISVVSHELRTPLTSIRSVLGLLASGLLGQLNDRGQSMVHVGISNTDRLTRLVSDLLDLERINSGRAATRREVCQTDQLMRQAAESVRALAAEAHVSIEVVPLEARVVGDPDRLLQVLINLLANAIKFSPASGGSVWLDAELTPDEVLLRVRDEGRGIPSDKLESVFERFARVDEHDARDKRGTGLGLAISRAIVQQHGGHIWAESRPGAGTTVCVALPIQDVLSGALPDAA
ncbi:MAG: PAS domain-containing protein [Chloroflexi bacterium]|nr:PAS domain-containing protein [Chloroflexota bacterium]